MIQIIQDYPLLSLIVISFFITLVLTLIYKFSSNQNEIKSSKEKIKEIQNRIKQEKDPDKIMEINKEMLEANMEQIRHSMKPMIITMPLVFLIFIFLRNTFLPFGVFIPWNFNIPLICAVQSPFHGFCDGAGWLLVYFISSLVFNTLIRKVMKVH